MKLFEIENYLQKKVRRKSHDEGYFLIFKNGFWYNPQYNFNYNIIGEVEEDDWEEYAEPKEKTVKRYWQWIVDHDDLGFIATARFFDDELRPSRGIQESYLGKDFVKKISSEWIDADENGNIVDCSDSFK